MKPAGILSKDKHLTGLFIIFLLVTAVMCVLKPAVFFSAANFRSMTVQFPELGFLSIAASIVLIIGGIDLSITGTAALSGIIAALIIKTGENPAGEIPIMVMACLALLAVGALCGTVNALLVAKFGIAPMLATLGTLNLFTGIGIVLTKGSAVSKFPQLFLYIGSGAPLGVPVPLILFLLAITSFSFFLTRTKYGYKLFVVGSNPTASFYSAINNTQVTFYTYIISGIVSSIAGIIMVSRVNTARADFGSSYGLQALLVAVLGGINPSGGSGKALGLFLSIITLQFLSSGFNILHVSPFLKDLTWGFLLVFIMVLNVIKIKRKTNDHTANGG
jgi:simple sugar transport system permease protein